ncbi:hypothetical protein RRG08_047352 [Elysia crispata]|uniref:Secreted protein n=1 Tax=Elysia crispata TaxID=231223 RepID=A0AAE1E711_9GAST|nr:hypothetical protein RRG08_047352 [Elysia crispata]
MYTILFIVLFASASSQPLTGCSTEVTACEQRYLKTVNDATFDKTANCLAGTALMKCLSQRESLAECKSSLPEITRIKQLYDAQVNSPVSTPEARSCAQAVFSCSETYNNQVASNTAGICQATNMYIACLNSVKCNSSSIILETAKGLMAIKHDLAATGQSCTSVETTFTVIEVELSDREMVRDQGLYSSNSAWTPGYWT